MTATLEGILADARSRARTVDRRATDLRNLIGAVVDDLRPLADSRGVRLRLSAEEPVEARVDHLAIERAVANLITNAIEHSPRGEAVDVAVVGEGEVASVEVTDHGRGIAPADQEQVFDRCWRGESGDGAGIGLAIVRQVAAAHGGHTSVTSPVQGDAGSRFALVVRK
jgi:signal transduction histidine kinase